MRTEPSRWRGAPSIRAHDGDLGIEVVPCLGAKVVSIAYRHQELLVQPADDFVIADRPQDYLASGLCGWDEMFPTVIGQGLPDHGELWSRPAECAVRGDTLYADTECTTVPVIFSRGLSLRASTIVAVYGVRNLSDRPVETLWAAHPQFIVTPTSRLTAAPTSWVQVSGTASAPDPVSCLLVDAVRPGRTAKWWSAIEDRPRSITLSDDDITFTQWWPSGSIRHLGVWVDMSALAATDAVSLQPSTGWHDDLHRASANGSALVLPPRGSATWETRLHVSPTRPF